VPIDTTSDGERHLATILASRFVRIAARDESDLLVRNDYFEGRVVEGQSNGLW
jgi:hypothetical protein